MYLFNTNSRESLLDTDGAEVPNVLGEQDPDSYPELDDGEGTHQQLDETKLYLTSFCRHR